MPFKCGRRNCRPTYAPNWDQFRNNHASHQRHVVALLISHASVPVQLIMLMLLGISIMSWTYIFAKRLAIKRADSPNSPLRG